METNPLTALQKAVAISGGQVALAKKLGLKQGHVWWWLNRSKRIPAEQTIAVEQLTGVSRHELRPDVFGHVPEDRAA
jgi:DNA-binding transcriptional regulator YdaS (Cro superfamily)